MKPLLILGFALILGFLAPLAQAAPPPVTPEPTHFDAPPPPPGDDRRADPAPPPSGNHDPDRGPHSDPDKTGRDHDRSAPAPAQDDDTPAATDATDQDSAPAYDEGAVLQSDDSAPQPAPPPAHYTMDDLANAASSLDAPYDATHFSMDDIGGL